MIAVCGSKFKRAFDGLDLTMRFFFDSLQMRWPDGAEGSPAAAGKLATASKLYVRHVDAPGEIERHPEFMEQARELGRRLAVE